MFNAIVCSFFQIILFKALSIFYNSCKMKMKIISLSERLELDNISKKRTNRLKCLKLGKLSFKKENL